MAMKFEAVLGIEKINKLTQYSFYLQYVFAGKTRFKKKIYDMLTSAVVYIYSLCVFENLLRFIVFDDG